MKEIVAWDQLLPFRSPLMDLQRELNMQCLGSMLCLSTFFHSSDLESRPKSILLSRTPPSMWTRKRLCKILRRSKSFHDFRRRFQAAEMLWSLQNRRPNRLRLRTSSQLIWFPAQTFLRAQSMGVARSRHSRREWSPPKTSLAANRIRWGCREHQGRSKSPSLSDWLPYQLPRLAATLFGPNCPRRTARYTTRWAWRCRWLSLRQPSPMSFRPFWRLSRCRTARRRCPKSFESKSNQQQSSRLKQGNDWVRVGVDLKLALWKYLPNKLAFPRNNSNKLAWLVIDMSTDAWISSNSALTAALVPLKYSSESMARWRFPFRTW